MLSMKQFFVPAIVRRNPRTPREWLRAFSIKKNKLFTSNDLGQVQKKQRRSHISKQKNNAISKLEFTLEKLAHLTYVFNSLQCLHALLRKTSSTMHSRSHRKQPETRNRRFKTLQEIQQSGTQNTSFETLRVTQQPES